MERAREWLCFGMMLSALGCEPEANEPLGEASDEIGGGIPDHSGGLANPQNDWVVELRHIENGTVIDQCTGFLATPRVVFTSGRCLFDRAIDVGDGVGFGPVIPSKFSDGKPLGDNVYDDQSYTVSAYTSDRHNGTLITDAGVPVPPVKISRKHLDIAFLILDRRVDFQVAVARRPSFRAPNLLTPGDPVIVRWNAAKTVGYGTLFAPLATSERNARTLTPLVGQSFTATSFNEKLFASGGLIAAREDRGAPTIDVEAEFWN